MFLVFLNKLKEIIKKKKLLVFLIFIFAFYFNSIYSNIGVLPLDTFFHFDPGFRIMQGFFPIKDFWVVSGLVPDLMQALFFYVLGVSWNTLVIHSSILNGIVSVSTFIFLKKIGLNKIYALIYSLFLAILAYPLSGTPFVDHHAVFFSLLSLYFFIFAVESKKNYYWIVVVTLLFFSFFSKQVPASYFASLLILITIYYCYVNKTIKPLAYSFFSLIFYLFFIYFLLFVSKIDLNSFFIQYFFYPPSIAAERLKNLTNFSVINFIHEFKFILIPLVILIILNFKKILKNSSYLKKNDFIFFIGILSFAISLVFYQTITKNQNLTYFLSIILFAYFHSLLPVQIIKYKKLLINLILFFSFVITLKIHFEYNENRKYHDLKNANLKIAKDAALIDKKLKNLKWISTNYMKDPHEEIEYLKNTLGVIKKDKRKKIVITNYLFFSSVLNENLHSPSRSFTPDGASYPRPKNKYFNEYKKFFKKNITKNKIKVIYVVDLEPSVVSNYLDSTCILDQSKKNKLYIFEIDEKC